MKVLPSASSKVYDVVFLVEAAPSLSTHFDIIKQSYLHPTLEHFNDGPSDDTDHGCDYSCTLYGLVTFSTSDTSPYPTIQAWQPTISTYQLEHSFDEIKFSGTMGDSYSHMADGLSCVMQVFDDIDTLRDARVTTAEKHCIVVCNSPPGDIPGQSNVTYCGYTIEQLLLLMNEKGINISIISPRKIPALYRFFEKAGGDLSSMRTTNYATDSRHLVLLKGYQLKERPRSPAAVTGKFDKDTVKAEPVTMGIPSSVAIVNQVNSPAQGPFSQAGPTSVTFIKSNPTVAAVASSAADTTFKVPSATTQVPSVASPAAPVTVQPPAPPPSQVHQPHTQRMQNPVSVSVTPQQPGPVPPGAREAADKILNQITHDQRFSAPMQAQSVVQQPPVQVAATRVTVPAQIVRAPPPSSVAVSITQVGPMFTPGMNPNQQQQQQHLVTSQQHNVAIRQTSQPTTTVVNPETMNPGQPLASVVPHPQMKLVWTGALEWQDKTPADPTSKITRTLGCHVYNSAGEPEINTSKWPSKLTLQHLPSFWLQPLQHLFNKCRTLQFRFAKNDSEALKSLTNKFFKQALAGCIHFPPMAQCDIRIMMLLYSKGKQQFMGLIPTEQTALLENFKTIVQRHRESKKPGAQKVAPGAPAPGFTGQQQAFSSQQAPQQVMSSGAISGNVIPMSQTATAATTQQAPGGIMATGQQQPQQQQQQQPGQTPQQVDSVEAERRLNLQQMHNLQQQLAAAKQKELAFQQQVEKKKKAMETIAVRQQIMPQMAGDQQTDTRFTQNMLQAAVAQQQRQQMLQQLQQQQAAQQQQQQQAPQQTSQQQIRQMLINSQVGRQQQQLLQQQQQQQLLLQQQRSRMPAAAVQQQATVGQPMQQGGISMQPGLPGQMQPQSQGGQGFMSDDLDLQTFLS